MARYRAERPKRRILPRIAVVFAFLLVVIIGGGYGYLLTTLPKTNDVIDLEGLSDRVTISRNAQGVPLIQADSERDGLFALGFVHAQDRFFQMEMTRRLGAGRLAEVIGEGGVGTDKFMRTLGLYRLAEAEATAASPALKASLAAYAAGVNAWIERKIWPRTPEFLLLQLDPEPWKPADSLVWGKLMAMQLSQNWRSEALRMKLLKTMKADDILDLWAEDSDPTAVTSRPPLPRLAEIAPLLDFSWDPRHQGAPATASNAWAFSGSRTTTGMPLLANDPHLQFQAPILWYLARLETPDLTLVGATVPGVPMLLIGHNTHVAWGFTTTGGDTEDLYLEETTDDGSRYRTGSGAKPFETREEIISVRDEEPVTLVVRETDRGPVLSGIVDRLSNLGIKYQLSLQATYLQPGDKTADALHAMNRATTWEEFDRAASNFHSPQQNIFAADRRGTIGYVAAGRIPVRPTGDGLFPRRGWDPLSEWAGFLPYERLPRTVNPGAGQILNANNRVVPPNHPDLIAKTWEAPYRYQRLRELASRHETISPDIAADMQKDPFSAMAAEMVPLMLGALDAPTPGDGELLDELRSWDFTMTQEKRAPLVLYLWLRETKEAIFADELGAFYAEWRGFRVGSIKRALTLRSIWCDVTKTVRVETCGEQLARALSNANAALERLDQNVGGKATWGDAHPAQFSHPILSRIGPLKEAFTLSIPTQGGNYTLDRGATWSGDEQTPFPHKHGSGLRVMMDLSDLDASRFMIATGQSANIFSKHYGDLVEPWAAGEMLTLGPEDWTGTETRFRTVVLSPITD